MIGFTGGTRVLIELGHKSEWQHPQIYEILKNTPVRHSEIFWKCYFLMGALLL